MSTQLPFRSYQSAPTALILVTDTAAPSLWAERSSGLGDALRERLPGTVVIGADSAERPSLDHALAVARFQGAGRAVVVRLWGDRVLPPLKPNLLAALPVNFTEAPPDADAVATVFLASTMELPSELPVAV